MLIALAAAAACASTPRYESAPNALPRPALRRAADDPVASARLDMLRRARVWAPIDTASLDLLQGPEGKGRFAFDEAVTCRFQFPDKPLTGLTPKFRCVTADGDDFKVKYGRDNGEVYAEVAATRLFWALGFFADRMYPVRVTCVDCPLDPFEVSRAAWHRGVPAERRALTFDPAIVERNFARELEFTGHQGWRWPELTQVSAGAGGAPRAHLDALRLLAVFVQHTDTKPEQQTIVCAKGDLLEEPDGATTCAAPKLMVKDLGATFGAAKRFDFNKMHFASWRDVPIWKDAEACVGHLKRAFTGNLSDPQISEEGRAFLAARLALLSDTQIRDLFVAARVERKGEKIKDADGTVRPVTVEDWVAAFKNKREQISARRCPA